jgi:hypothetical protein
MTLLGLDSTKFEKYTFWILWYEVWMVRGLDSTRIGWYAIWMVRGLDSMVRSLDSMVRGLDGTRFG